MSFVAPFLRVPVALDHSPASVISSIHSHQDWGEAIVMLSSHLIASPSELISHQTSLSLLLFFLSFFPLKFLYTTVKYNLRLTVILFIFLLSISLSSYS